MAVYDVPPQVEYRGGSARPVNRYDKRRFNAAYQDNIRSSDRKVRWRILSF